MRRLILLLSVFTGVAVADENAIVLKHGQGKELVSSQCAMCHSLDYITMSADVLDRAGWEKTVNKMINVMNAPINEADKKVIVDYLIKNYSK
jgi:cytochrome c5